MSHQFSIQDSDTDPRVSYNHAAMAKSGQLSDIKLPLHNLLVNNMVSKKIVVESTSSGHQTGAVEPGSALLKA